MIPFRRSTPFPAALALLALWSTAGCQPVAHPPGPEAQETLASISPTDLRDILSQLARSHEQKMQLVFFLSLPWGGVEPLTRDFFSRMGTQQSDLDKEIHAWAKAHDLDLTFHFSDDVLRQAQQTMEDRQQKVILADNRADLTRDTLIQMWADYEWQVSLLQSFLPKVHDPALKAYVQRSLKIHTEGSAEITTLLKRFKVIEK